MVKLMDFEPNLKSPVGEIIDILGDKKVDLLFIDGDHTYEGVKQDYEMYKEFVRKDGYIILHDIKNSEYHNEVNCKVYQFWNEIDAFKLVEYIDSRTDFGGIGVIVNKEYESYKSDLCTKPPLDNY